MSAKHSTKSKVAKGKKKASTKAKDDAPDNREKPLPTDDWVPTLNGEVLDLPLEYTVLRQSTGRPSNNHVWYQIFGSRAMATFPLSHREALGATGAAIWRLQECLGMKLSADSSRLWGKAMAAFMVRRI